MMKIYLANDSKQGLGGGWTFRRNLAKGIKKIGHQITENLNEADIALISGVTMVTRDTVKRIKKSKAKLVVRIDNVPRNSRNRNTGTSRLKDFTGVADAVVYQSLWARDYLGNFIGKRGRIIYNGVDTDIFNKEGKRFVPPKLKDCNEIFLYSRYSRDETKQWHVAWYEYQKVHGRNPKAGLIIVGRFSPEQQKYNFDFFQNENYVYLGVISDPKTMAEIYRGADFLMATYWADCFSNTYIEALACGTKLYKPDKSGGTPELMRIGVIDLETMAKTYEKLFNDLMKGRLMD
jgi:glycosyltransferase involved in cell wall biosynthesis